MSLAGTFNKHLSARSPEMAACSGDDAWTGSQTRGRSGALVL